MLLDPKQAWKSLQSSKEARPHHILQYFVLQALKKYEGDPAIIRKSLSFVHHKLAKALTPITREIKLKNGLVDFGVLDEMLRRAISRRKHYIVKADGLRLVGWVDRGILGHGTEEILTPKQQEDYEEILRGISLKSFREYYNREYVYIFVRQDISPEYQLVQAAHVALRLGYKLGFHSVQFNMTHDRMKELYFTVIGVQNLSELQQVARESPGPVEVFFEPDLNDQLTAIAYMPVLARKRGALLKHKRLVFQQVVAT